MKILFIAEPCLKECAEHICGNNACPQVAIVCCTPLFTDDGCEGAWVGILAIEREGKVLGPKFSHQVQPEILAININNTRQQ